MAQQYQEISDRHRQFIADQKIFFIGTATADSRVNVSPKGMDALLKPNPGARQIFDVSIELVQSSCGMAVPSFDYVADRELLTEWAAKKGDAGLQQYWADKNQISMDGVPTRILELQSK